MHVIVIGGGVGGLTTAIALQAKGIAVDIYEAAPELRAVGAGIWLPPNAMQVLERLGLSEAITESGLPLERVELWNREGTLLQRHDLEETRRTFGHSIVSIHRAALQSILRERLAEGVLHLNRVCTGYALEEDGTVMASFSDGTQARGDVLIGADGIRSAIRKQMLPTATPRYAGQTCYRGIAEMTLPDDLRRTCREVWGKRRRIGFSAIGKDRVYWFAPLTCPAGHREEPGAAKTRLETLYASFPAPIPEMLARTPSSTIIRTDLYDCPNVATWHTGNVALLGDAAHASTPNLGQGGAQAIEDARVVADCLSRCSGAGDIPGALAEYERVRLPKAQQVIRLSWRIGQLAHVKTRLLRMLRDEAVRWTPDRITQRQFESLYRVD